MFNVFFYLKNGPYASQVHYIALRCFEQIGLEHLKSQRGQLLRYNTDMRQANDLSS